MRKKSTNFTERFDFGENWKNYNKKYLTEDKIRQANEAFIKFTEIQTLKELTVVDIGCGSGIHSLNFSRMNPKLLLSFDYDYKSVEATNYLKEVHKNKNWDVKQGSILDEKFLLRMPQFDLVYAWGVLHHTGNVWLAIKNSCDLVSEGGILYLALYSSDVKMLNRESTYWLKVKKKYNQSGFIVKRLIELSFISREKSLSALNFLRVLIKSLVSRQKNKTKFFSRQKRYRGMSYLIDVRDWLGGWPMEYVSDDAVIELISSKNFVLKKIKKGEACTEFLFKKGSGAN
jgi:2-polyprenyl-6-hydroxyphenyl methylase/3-demethylubiquinone-9 3-methyltransferase